MARHSGLRREEKKNCESPLAVERPVAAHDEQLSSSRSGVLAASDALDNCMQNVFNVSQAIDDYSRG